MEDAIDDEEEQEITLRRPFQAKFMAQLNYMQNEKNKKNKRKMREHKYIDPRKMQKFQKLGMSPSQKIFKKMPETIRNGNKIYGVWKNNQLQGQAQIIYSNGVIFRGTYQNGIKVKGHFKLLHGYEYIGHCLGNKFDGQGSLIFPSGKIITGEWKDYNLIDKGKIQYPQGQVYYGQIRNLKKHGQGYLFFQDGSKYVGQFQDGQITGEGKYYINDQLVSSGYWVNGELEETIDPSNIQSDDENNRSDMKQSIKKANKNIERGGGGNRGQGRGGKVEQKIRFAETTANNLKEIQKKASLNSETTMIYYPPY